MVEVVAKASQTAPRAPRVLRVFMEGIEGRLEVCEESETLAGRAEPLVRRVLEAGLGTREERLGLRVERCMM